jgi:hypothetical protein
MENKKWFKSKAIIAGVIGVLIAVYNSASGALAAGCEPGLIEGTELAAEGLCYVLPAIPNWIFGILSALGIYGRKVATTVIK